MRTRYLLSAMAAAAFVVASPALAQGRGGGHGGGHGGGMGGGGMGGGMGAGHGGGLGSFEFGREMRELSRDNARAAERSAERARLRANENSVFGTRTTPSDRRATARLNSRGAAHASATGLAHANANSVLSGTTVVAGPLTGLQAGTSLIGTNGLPVGTVARIVPSRDGVVRNVLVRLPDGRILPLAPSSVALSGTQWTALSLLPNDGRR